MNKNCENCNNEFKPGRNHPNQKYCYSCMPSMKKKYSLEYQKEKRKDPEFRKKQCELAKKWRTEHPLDAKKKDYDRYWNNLDAERKRVSDYKKTEHGKINHRKDAKVSKARRKNMSFNPIMKNPYPSEIKIDWHHINSLFVIPIPKRFHSLHSSNCRELHITKCNEAIRQIGYFDIDLFINIDGGVKQ